MKENVRFTIDIPREFHSFLKKKAIDEGVSLRRLVLMTLGEKSMQRTDENPVSSLLKI